MTRLCCLVLALTWTRQLLSQSEATSGQQLHPPALTSAVSLRESTEISVSATNVSAAYSLDPLIAEAQADDGQIRIWGRSPGQAVIIVVQTYDFSTSTIRVTVTQAPPILPDTFWSGLSSEDQNANGYLDFRLSSDPMQMNEAFDYRTSWTQLHITNILSAGTELPGTSSVRFPFSYLKLIGGRWKATLLDDNVESSPLSVTSTVLRGVHFSDGDFTVHAGYTSVAGFQSLFLPAYKQLILGSTWTHRISENSQIGATAYLLQRTPLMPGRRGRELATLFIKRHTLNRSDLFAELGVSKGIGGAITATHDTDTDQIYLNARYRPRLYAASDTDNLNGLQSEGRWNHFFDEQFASTLSGSQNDIFTLAGRENIQVVTESLRYKVSNTLSLSSGVSLSRLSDAQTFFANIRRLAVPIGLTYDRARFGLGLQYEYSQTSHAFSPGHAYRASARWNRQHFQVSAAGGLETQSLGIDSVYSTFPGLTVALAQLGLDASTNIDQLAALLKQRAFLNSLGIAPDATLQLVPRNCHANLNLSWRSARQALELESNYNLQSFLTQRSTMALETARYRRALRNASELITSFTLLDTLAPYPRRDVVWQIGIRHQLGGSPFQRSHVRGEISGTVRLEDSSGVRPLGGVEITLDAGHRALSDAEGHYHFSGLSPGFHTVQVAFRSARPFWYSTPSKVSTKTDSTVDFGIVYPSAQVLGYVLDDSGQPLAGLGIVVKGTHDERNVTTDGRGRFVAPVIEAGTYRIGINTETVPDGYAVEELQSLSVSVEVGESRKVSFKVQAIRALAGLVQKYDIPREDYVPVSGARVRILELDRQTTTSADGRYLFREMPSGIFTILVNGKEYGQVQFSAAPQLLRYDIRLHSATLAAASRP